MLRSRGTPNTAESGRTTAGTMMAAVAALTRAEAVAIAIVPGVVVAVVLVVVVLTGEGSGVTRASRARTSSTYHMYKWLNFAAARPIDRPINCLG
jgi:hypothetical protein